MRWRLVTLVTTVGLLAGIANVLRGDSTPLLELQSSSMQKASILQAFYTPPVLVRAGEPVRVPLDVVCATADGDPCEATAAISVRAGDGAWRESAARFSKGLAFDLTASAARAVTRSPSGAFAFYLRARSADGRSVSLGRPAAALSVHVTRDLTVVRAPSIPFGRLAAGRPVLDLPWGSGPMRAGLAPGVEAATLGPPSFDVDGRGRIHLLDALQGRVAVFDQGRLASESRLRVSGRADLASGDDGSELVLDQANGLVRLRMLGPDGHLRMSRPFGPGPVSAVRLVGLRPFVHLLPLDAWVPGFEPSAAGPARPVGEPGNRPATTRPARPVRPVRPVGEPGNRPATTRPARPVRPVRPVVGIPLRGGRELLRVGTEHAVRLGMALGDRVWHAVEVRSAQRLGEVALAEPDAAGGYWLVVRTWRPGPRPADQFQVMHVAGDRVTSSFAVGAASFADALPSGRFRIGGDGALYQMTSSSSGLRIVRYELGEGDR